MRRFRRAVQADVAVSIPLDGPSPAVAWSAGGCGDYAMAIPDSSLCDTLQRSEEICKLSTLYRYCMECC
jgi:hypothetical protein